MPLTLIAQPPFFLVSQSWINSARVESLCQSIYFPLNPVAAGSFTLFYGLLFYIIRDYLHAGDTDLARFDLQSSLKLCEQYFATGLSTPEIMVDPTLEKIQALLLGVRRCLLCLPILTVAGYESTRGI